MNLMMNGFNWLKTEAQRSIILKNAIRRRILSCIRVAFGSKFSWDYVYPHLIFHSFHQLPKRNPEQYLAIGYGHFQLFKFHTT